MCGLVEIRKDFLKNNGNSNKGLSAGNYKSMVLLKVQTAVQKPDRQKVPKWTAEDHQSVLTEQKSGVRRPRISLEIFQCGTSEQKELSTHVINLIIG